MKNEVKSFQTVLNSENYLISIGDFGQIIIKTEKWGDKGDVPQIFKKQR